MSGRKALYSIILLIYLSSLQAQNSQCKISVKKSGTGEQSILFIPGLGCSGKVWNKTIRKLKKNYTCYEITMPGFAGVPACSDPSFILFEKLIIDFIHENKIDKPILVGHSLGGSLSMALAGDFSKLFSKIVVVDALPFLLVLNTPLEVPDTLNCNKEVEEVLEMKDEQFYRIQKQTAWRFTVDTLNQRNIIRWAVQSDRKTFAKLYCDLTNTDLRKRISGIECPSLILLQPNFSDRQQAVSEQFQNLAEKKIEYASRGLHFIMYDDYKWFINELTAFLKKQ